MRRLSRVCMINPQGYMMYPPPLGKTDTGGQTLYVLQLAKALGEKNIKVDILTRQFDNMPEEEKIFDNVRIVRIPAGNKNFIPKEKLYEFLPEIADNFMHYIENRRKRYDILHSHYWDGGYVGLLLSKMLDIPHVHTPHSLGKLKKLEMSVEKLPPQKLKPAYRYHVRTAIEQKIINKADALVTICETSRLQLMEHYTVDFEKIQVIYPGIDIKIFHPKKNSVDSKLRLKENAILTICRLVPAKGLDRLVDSLSLIKNKVNFHLYMGGGGLQVEKSEEEKNTEKHLEELIKKYKMEKNSVFLGYIPHDQLLPAYYRAADIFVLAGRYEPFGLTTLEAMACGTIPIVSSIAGSREVIVDGLNGFIFDTSNRKGLSELILKILQDSKLRKKISENAAFTIKEHYSWDKIVEKFIKLYKNLI